jgi:hypothetical protein
MTANPSTPSRPGDSDPDPNEALRRVLAQKTQTRR